MTDEQVLFLVDSLTYLSGLDSFLGAFFAIFIWRLLDWLGSAFDFKPRRDKETPHS